MPDLGVELHLGQRPVYLRWLVWVLVGDLDVDLVLSSLVRCVWWSGDHGFPVVQISIHLQHLELVGSLVLFGKIVEFLFHSCDFRSGRGHSD